MARFSIGTIIKKVRGEEAMGVTAIVVGYDTIEAGFDIVVHLMEAAQKLSGYIARPWVHTDAKSEQWEPVIRDGLESQEETETLTPELETTEAKDWHTFRAALAEAAYVSDCGGLW